MNNIKLLESVIEDRLELTNGGDVTSNESKQAFKEAMEAIDRNIQIMKIEQSKEELSFKIEQAKEEREFKMEQAKEEREFKAEQAREEYMFKIEQLMKDQENKAELEKKNRKIRIIEIAAIPAGLFVLDCLFKVYFMRKVCNFEKDYTFTTTPGRSISGLFKFKK